jgi:hypothetical protein
LRISEYAYPRIVQISGESKCQAAEFTEHGHVIELV